jgi:hypothetical protein
VSHEGLWLTLAALGAYHGLNPAMGWLFAVALGMQEGERRGVLRALPPIALGHEAAVALAALLVLGLGLLGNTSALHMGAGIALVAFGLFRFARPRAHFRWVKARVSRRELAWWSFLMSTAHGAGLMVAPVLIGAGATTASAATDHDVQHVQAAVISPLGGGLALLLHVASMMVVMAVVAVVVYEKLGLAILRSAWVNTEWLWAAAFVLAGVVTLFT